MLNALAGLATAYACSSRVLFLVGQIPSHMIGEGRGFLHEIPNQSSILHGLTKWSGMAGSPEEVPGLLREAFAQLESGRPRPVAVEIPPDVLAREADVELLDPAPPPAPSLDMGRIRDAAALLARARRPVIVAGHGVEVAKAHDELRALAERLRAPVTKSWFGRPALDDRHPLAVPPHGLAMLLSDADLVLVVGSRFMTRVATPVEVGKDTRTVAINTDPRDLGHPRTYDATVRGDAGPAMAALLAALPAETAGGDGAARAARARAWCAEQLVPIEPQMGWVRALRQGIDETGVLVNDLTQVGFVNELGYEVRGPETFVTPGYQGTLGYSFPTALGAKLGDPHRAVVAVVGDGGFGYALAEMATARRYGIGVIVVIFTDDAYGNVRRTQRESFNGRVLGSELTNPDFVALAKSFGVFAARVDCPEELTRQIRERAHLGEPTLIEIRQGEVPSPWHLIVGSRNP
jgi:acetolactate synthase-1/2/3 large subunit